jgi:small-conductance mechanosensitive channel
MKYKINEVKMNKFKIILALILFSAVGVLFYNGAFEPVIKFLDSDDLSFTIGKSKYTAFKVIKAIVALVFVFWIAQSASNFIDRYFKKFNHLNPSNRALIVKTLQIGVFFLALLTAMDMIGIDLKALTIFGGALGIGIGFGLQKITSNFMSGVILLFEKSVKEGDLLELADGTTGYVRKISARYTLFESFENKEVLIPNEDLITQRVINLTLSNSRGRVNILVGVDYNSDMDLVKNLLLDSANSHPRTSKIEKPICQMSQFADSAVIFKLHVWVDDVKEGRSDVQSDIMFKILENFKANNIKVPYPTREIFINKEI